MATPATLPNLPADLRLLIMQHLDTMDIMRMRMTCSALYAGTPPPSVDELVELERTIFRGESGLYTCGVCL